MWVMTLKHAVKLLEKVNLAAWVWMLHLNYSIPCNVHFADVHVALTSQAERVTIAYKSFNN